MASVPMVTHYVGSKKPKPGKKIVKPGKKKSR
jgi:hypothetical protein